MRTTSIRSAVEAVAATIEAVQASLLPVLDSSDEVFVFGSAVPFMSDRRQREPNDVDVDVAVVSYTASRFNVDVMDACRQIMATTRVRLDLFVVEPDNQHLPAIRVGSVRLQ